MKIVLQIIGLLAVLGIIGYWYLHYGPGSYTPAPIDTAEPPTDTVPNMAPPTEPPPGSSTATTPDSTESSATDLTELITIDVTTLPDGQQTLLRTLGVGDTITLTPEMVTCAEAEIGATRLDEIVAGDTPSFSEGFALVNCYRQ